MVQLIINSGEDILDNLWTNLINTGARKRRHDSSHTGLIFSAIATELNIAISLLQSYADQFTMSTMTDRVLIENLASQYAIRRVASKSKAILYFYRLEGFTEPVKIPAGFTVRANTSGNILFKTATTVYLWKGEQSVSVMAYSIGSGSKNNVDSNTLTIFANDNFNGLMGVTNPDPAFGGYDDESISHLRDRALGFRYARDKTSRDIQRQLYEAGLSQQQYYMEEFIDGPGTYMICIDTDSDSAFQDAISRLNYRTHYGVRPVYIRATRMYVDMYITVDTAYETDYTRYQKEEIYRNINDAIQKFFAAYCVVGANVRVNALKGALNNTLSSFNISNIDIEIANIGITDKDKNIIEVGNTTRAYPNKILTSINYVGGE